MDKNENRFERDIQTSLVRWGGWSNENCNDNNFDTLVGIDKQKLINFIQTTQSKSWKRYTAIFKSDAPKKLIKRFNEVVNTEGILFILRNGFKDRGVHFRIVYFKPVSGLNYDSQKRYEANQFNVIRQFAYSPNNNNTIDMVLMINGIPLVALELKNQYTGQNVEHAKVQFQRDRDPKELVFSFNKRFLVYFAVDHYEVFMTTRLSGRKTFFLPFNQGSNGPGKVGGKGNPARDSYPTEYLWKNTLQRDNLMDIINRFMNLEIKKEKVFNKEITKKTLIFPRYHQLDVVRKLVADVKLKGSGENYLIQHSAGSGKSNSIAWLSYHLSSLHDIDNNPVFTSTIIVTDRTVLDRQLQNTIMSFDHTTGQVETIGDNKTSQDLKNAINDGRKIIITTLQKFPVIYKEVDEMSGRNFAIIVDEAHSSQTGNSAQKLKSALADKNASLKEYQEIEESVEASFRNDQDELVETLLTQGRHKNLSFFAFTATPKEKTIEMFGKKNEDGSMSPFHVYSMRQAIEEGFILDVLSNYMTYKTSYRIAKEIDENPELPKTEAVKAIARYQSFHPWVLRQKTEVIIEQFREVTMRSIEGKGKAMVVTPSRLHAVRYLQEFRKYIKEKGYEDIGALVAFSGTVTDEDGNDYTEPSLNRTNSGEKIGENQLKETFHDEDFNILIVAEKYQTGFDEPLLHTMFVDKKLRGVKAVQTLSRLNRMSSGKKDTFVLDFVNNGEDIAEAFQPYYEKTNLMNEINVNMIYDTQNKLRKYNIYNNEDIATVIKLVKQAQKKQDERLLGRISSSFKPALNRYFDLEEDVQDDFRVTLRNFNKWYNYISQLDRTFDMELLEESIYTNYLIKFIPAVTREKVNINEKVNLEFYKLNQDFQGDIALISEEGELYNPEEIDTTVKPPDEREELDEIIQKVNDRFPDDFTSADKVIIESLSESFNNNPDPKLVNMAKNNSKEMFVESLFKEVFLKQVMNEYKGNQQAFDKLIGGDQEYYDTVYRIFAGDYYNKLNQRAD